LQSGEVHVWIVPLQGVIELALLSAPERERAQRFAFADDARRYARAHAAMRTILGDYLGRAPEAIQLERDHLGKPCVPGTELRCSLSRAGELALVAVGWGWPLGVDVEQVRALPDADALRRAYFTERERRHLERCTDEAELLRLWTRKEALLKATGEGLRAELRELEVYQPESLGGWHLVDLAPGEGYVAAVAVGEQVDRVVMVPSPDDPGSSAAVPPRLR
jgi:4'-phosphopantetheinyl transferase